jgi:hypothetical protein
MIDPPRTEPLATQKPLGRLGEVLARFLTAPMLVRNSGPATEPTRLLACLRPADVLLVEGSSRFSSAIKYLTQSPWSHAALYVGSHLSQTATDRDHCFVEVDLVEGVRTVGISEFENVQTRICRPIGLDETERRKVTSYVIERLGSHYDLRNIADLVRYLLPNPPIPQRFRRHMIAVGSGDPTRAICSTLIAQAFQSIRYPILPIVNARDMSAPDCPACIEEILTIRHHGLFTPRDFDVSPYFQIVKPLIDGAFDFRALRWDDQAQPHRVASMP